MHYLIKKPGLWLMTILFIHLLHSCTDEMKAKIPAYIEVDTIKLKITDPMQGSARHKFKDVWLFVNDNLIGAYELPAKIPVLAEGNCKVVIVPGILLNGFAGLRAQYTPIKPYNQTLKLKPDSVIKITPEMSYDPSINFQLTENFEAGSKFIKTASSSSDFLQLLGVSFEGANCGYASLQGDELQFECESIQPFFLPNPTAKNIYLELHYKSNTKFNVAIKGVGSTPRVIGVQGINKSDVWNKIYVGLTPAVNSYTGGSNFRLMFNFQRDTSVTKQELFLDNIKVLY
jgi:hypothetical protein